MGACHRIGNDFLENNRFGNKMGDAYMWVPEGDGSVINDLTCPQTCCVCFGAPALREYAFTGKPKKNQHGNYKWVIHVAPTAEMAKNHCLQKTTNTDFLAVFHLPSVRRACSHSGLFQARRAVEWIMLVSNGDENNSLPETAMIGVWLVAEMKFIYLRASMLRLCPPALWYQHVPCLACVNPLVGTPACINTMWICGVNTNLDLNTLNLFSKIQRDEQWTLDPSFQLYVPKRGEQDRRGRLRDPNRRRH